MAFTASDVKNLREMTGVGMMDCKKALAATDGDMDKACEWLREKGLAAAQKKASRIAAEGMAYAAVVDGIGVVVEVNSETDFAAKNDLFVAFVKGVAEAVAKSNPTDVEALMGCSFPGTELTVEQQQQEIFLSIRENIKVRRFERYAAGFSVPYIHAGGKIGVIVNMEVEGIADMAPVVELGKDVAMQIAAMNPMFRDKSDVDDAFIAKEKEIRLAQAKEDPKNANKPDAIIEKIVMGGIQKYYSEICLLQQAFVKESKMSVEEYVASIAKAQGGKIVVKAYTRFEKGEGIEKKKENLAEEIAKMVK